MPSGQCLLYYWAGRMQQNGSHVTVEMPVVHKAKNKSRPS